MKKKEVLAHLNNKIFGWLIISVLAVLPFDKV